MKNLWIALANPESEDITKVNGYLKLSLSVLNSNDERVELNPNLNNDSDCMIPPQIKTVYKQLIIYIFKAEQLLIWIILVKKKKLIKNVMFILNVIIWELLKKLKFEIVKMIKSFGMKL